MSHLGSPPSYSVGYDFLPNQDVWVISGGNCPSAVLSGVNMRVKIIIFTTTEVKYEVRLNGDLGTTDFLEADVFPTLASATAEYEIRLT